MIRTIGLFLFLQISLVVFSHNTAHKNEIGRDYGQWRGMIHRADGNDVVFNFSLTNKNGKPLMIISNSTEKIIVKNIEFKKDSVFIRMPVFESSFRAKVSRSGWEGIWVKGTSSKEQVIPFSASINNKRFEPVNGNARFNISGRWTANFASDKSVSEASIAEFVQKGNKVTGTFLTPTGDYRYQEGIVTGDKLMLSGFDGAHAFLFTATISNDKNIVQGMFYSGAKSNEGFTATKNAKATVSTEQVDMFLKPGEHKLDFKYPDLNGKMVSINDSRFKNKVVVIQILGSWCPNCMDETAFLTDYYNKNKQRGVEVVGLAYEYSTDFKRSVNSLSKFRDRFNVPYPLLITGVTVSDSLRTEKTLPQVTPIKVFPSSIFLDKKGNVRKFDTGFFGPGTGEHYEVYKKDFRNTIDSLLKE